ncbi:MAG: DNA repair protein RadC [Oscillospiraceae bacterium]|nr:DNA repair protein RadC [Oscillospiraceae bacterium]
MGIHEGHRARLRESFLEHGLQSMNDINALEMLLFYALPRRDTNETAHLLLERFGSLDGVFSAPVEDLCEVEGIGEYAAALIALIPEIMKKARLSKSREIRQIKCSEDAGEYLLPYFMNERDEVVYMLCLDAKRAVICCAEMGRGVVNTVDANIRRMVEKALKVKACSVIIAHNHPDGIAIPSREDDIFTKCLYNALETVGIRLEDHIIVADEDYISVADSGMMSFYKY